MAPYIGTATSRVDGIAKVTGAAKYAAEFNVPGLAHAAASSARRSRRAASQRIDTSAAHARRRRARPCSRTRTARPWRTTIKPTRTRWRRTARRSGRCTTARSCSTASRSRWWLPRHRRSRASRRRWSGWNTRAKPHVTDVFRQRDAAVPVKAPTSPIEAMFAPPKPRGTPRQALAAAAVRHEAEYYVPIEHHNPMELYASTVIFEGRRQAHGLRQDPGRAERAEVSLRRVRHEAGGRARHVAVHGRRIRLRAAPAVPGGAGRAGGARAAALGARRADAAADVRAGLPAGDDPAHRARRQRPAERSTRSRTMRSP